MKQPIAPYITEKSYAGIAEDSAAAATYTFKLRDGVRKEDVRKLVEAAYGVTVTDVRTVTIPGKARVFRGVRGRTSELRKALVRLAPGQRIAAFQAGDEQPTNE